MKSIIRSAEYRGRKNVNGTTMSNKDFVEWLFRDMYFYGNTESLYSSWLTKLNRGTMTRLQVVNALLSSSQYTVILNLGRYDY
jgi:hypothetical protein